MRSLILLGTVLSVMPGLVTSVSAAPKPAKEKVPFSDTAINKAIKDGTDYLWSKQNADGSWPPYGQQPVGKYQLGPTAIATYALLESGVSAQDERIVKAIDFLTEKTKARIKKSLEHTKGNGGENLDTVDVVRTYEAGLTCSVYNAANRTTNNKYAKELEELSKLVWENHHNGGYNYNIVRVDPSKESNFDNSNSQYGLLAVWAAAMSNTEVPKEYWWAVMRHWQNTQAADGGWCYQEPGLEGRCTMTAAGVASMLVCFDNLFADVLVGVNNPNSEFKPIQRGLDWFDKNFEDSFKPGSKGSGGNHYYYLYGVERVGLASGFKYFGTSDWYKIGANMLLNGQKDSHWGYDNAAVVDTSFSILFLVRGRNSVLFNKLQYEGDWRNRSRDLAMLTKWLSRNFEREVNWQIINLKVPVSEWHDAPIVYIAGSTMPKFTPDDIEKLRQFVLQGGTLFCITEGNGSAFTSGVRNLCGKMFPQYPLAAAPNDHELNTCYYTLPGKPKFSVVSNGVRALVIHTDNDLPKSWQQQNIATEKWTFEAGANVYMYVTDRGNGLRPRGTSLWPEAASEDALKETVKIARIQHDGNCDPEPLAWDRFKLLMGNLCKVKVEVAAPVAPAKLAESGAKLAVMTGTGAFTFSKEDRDAIAKFVDGGGTVLIDAAGGSKAFAQSANEMLAQMYGAESLKKMASGSEVLSIPGYSIDKFKYRRRTRTRLGTEPNLRAILVNDRPAVIFSGEDLTAGILGVASFSIDGYDPGDEGGTKPGTAFQIVRNIVLYAYGIKGTPTSASAPATDAATSPAP